MTTGATSSYWAVYDSETAELNCRIAPLTTVKGPNMPNAKQLTRKHKSKSDLPSLNTADLPEFTSKERKIGRRSGKLRASYLIRNGDKIRPKRLQRVVNCPVKDQMLSDDHMFDDFDSESVESDNYVNIAHSAANPNCDWDYDSDLLGVEQKSCDDLDWTLLEDINDNVYATTEQDNDVVLLKSSKSYLLALTSNLKTEATPKLQKDACTALERKKPIDQSKDKVKFDPTAGIARATVHIQSYVPEEYYIRKCQNCNSHRRGVKARRGVN